MQGELEYFFTCPYCNEQISMLLETYYSEQSYIEDCEVCCKPIQISYQSNEHEVLQFHAQTIDD
ncbi:MAG: CPXCG motif-containing cysteine-rich protein [Bdellovibrionales bacterium]|nr:CPXCG motif-containing cysteine-rich protein [Bdellovibrionales bacterium]